MSISFSARVRTGITGLVALGVLSFTAAAEAGPRAHLGAYNVEQFLAIEDGDSGSVTVACQTGDTLVGRSYKIDNVDSGIFTDVTSPAWSGATASSVTFTATYDDSGPNAEEMDGSRAQLKVYATCLGAKDSAGQVLTYTAGVTPAFSLAKFQSGSKWYQRTIPVAANDVDTAVTPVTKGKTADVFVACPKSGKHGYFALIGDFTVSHGLSVIGAEPRGNGFSYRVYNGTGSDVSSATVSSTVTCINKTTNKSKRTTAP